MASKEDQVQKTAKVIGLVRVENRDDIYLGSQDSTLEAFAAKNALDLVQIEHEVSNGNQIIRVGLWRALRLMACRECEPRQMPMSLDYDSWFQEALKPCNCRAPLKSQGILVSNIAILCSNPAQGSKFTLDMCLFKTHLFAAREKGCLSCCNPQAVAFLRRKTLGG